ncbi:hypothetical protein F2Q69_00041108 [Brassica cretica]|uniref:Phosphatidylserine decarboxylase n=1 Tax=Brassica cretica TaxID=69181 RepID=A0A8S9NNW7_BRACR|nr:hypothetical protein F2Q69_00041108 [Brassica cretica]
MLVAKDEVIDRKTKRIVEELIRLKDFSVHDSYLPVQNLGLDLWIKHFKVEEEIVFIVSTLHSDEFFIMELKPGARTMAYMNRDDVAVCAADCRLMVFQSVEDSTRFWIKGRKFSIRGLLGKNVNRNVFLDGSLVIFRLAPQDYHGFHVPVSGVIEKFGDVSRCLYTDQINMAEVKYPLQHFKTFNEFFIRELKPGARTMAYMNRDDVAV